MQPAPAALAGRSRLEPAELLYGRLLASARTAGGEPARRADPVARGGAHERCRWAAGSRRSTRPTARCSPARRRPCSTSAAVPAATLAALAAAGHAGLGLDLSPVAVRLARAPRRPTRSCGSVFARRPRRRPLGAPRCCSTATSASAARPRRCWRRAARAARAPAARCSSRPTRRARRPARDARAARGARRGQRRGSRWAHVGADGDRPARARRRACGRVRRSPPAAAGSRALRARPMTPAARPVPAGVLELAAARPVADRGARLDAARRS